MCQPAVAAAILLLFTAAGCGGSGTSGSGGDDRADVSFTVFEQDVTCDAAGDCRDVEGEERAGAQVAGSGVVSRGASRFAPAGFYLFFSYVRPGGVYGEVEIDFPTDAAGEVPYVASLREFAGGRELFSSDEARGVIDVAVEETGGRPRLGVFELLLRDFGEDGAAGTPDDRLRFLRRGAFSTRSDDGGSVGRVDYDDRCRVEGEPAVIFDITIIDDIDYDSSGSDDGTAGDWEGCEGDTYDSAGDDSTGGCGGDSGGGGDDWGSDGAGGCGGDDGGGSDDSGCDSDTYARGRGEGATSWAFMMPLFAPFLLRRLLGRRS